MVMILIILAGLICFVISGVYVKDCIESKKCTTYEAFAIMFTTIIGLTLITGNFKNLVELLVKALTMNV